MKTVMRSILVVLTMGTFLSGCNSKKSSEDKPQGKDTHEVTLQKVYDDYFLMGVAVSPKSLVDSSWSRLIKSQFNSMTAENVMKMGPIHPEENTYFWEDADKIAAFAQQHNIKLRGHTLCWHNQTPDWLFVDDR